MTHSPSDSAYMAHALRLAERGRYTTMPNPQVGCVLVRENQIVADGWHHRAGEPHAEANALARAGDRARGATAYVTLEPCSHTGRTGPCSDALLAAGVRSEEHTSELQPRGQRVCRLLLEQKKRTRDTHPFVLTRAAS